VNKLTRRAKAARWIINLNPLIRVVETKMHKVGLGEPRLETGPAWLPREHFEDQGGDRIRKGAVWFVTGRNCGFHVDFCANGLLHIEAWVGKERSTSTWITGGISEASLKKDLGVCLAAAGLTDLARTEEVRSALFSRTATK
jgi:hypothetical protein